MDFKDHLSIMVNSNMWNKTGGLCSNFNSNPADDFQISDDLTSSNLQSFVDTWKNDNVEDICELLLTMLFFF